MKNLYICGAISNNPNYKEDFFKADYALGNAKYFPTNPVLNCEVLELADWTECMKQLIPYLIEADGIALIPSDLPSRGRDLELHIAKELNIDVKTVDEWLELAKENKE